MVAGIRTPQDLDTMKDCMPEPYAELVENCKILESHYKEMMVQYMRIHSSSSWPSYPSIFCMIRAESKYHVFKSYL